LIGWWKTDNRHVHNVREKKSVEKGVRNRGREDAQKGTRGMHGTPLHCLKKWLGACANEKEAGSLLGGLKGGTKEHCGLVKRGENAEGSPGLVKKKFSAATVVSWEICRKKRMGAPSGSMEDVVN